MRSRTLDSLTIAAAALLLAGCSGTEPLAPTATDARMAGVAGPNSQLAAPSNVTVVATSAVTVRITWQDNSSDETGFEIYRSPGLANSGFTLSGSTGGNVTTYDDVGLSSPLDYCYQIRAVRKKGINVVYSAYSSAVCALAPPPAAPSDVTAVATSDSTIQITWQDNASDESRFEVYRSGYLNGSYASLGRTDANVTTYRDAGLAPNWSYCYQVRAVRQNPESYVTIASAFSTAVCATTPPAAPKPAVGTTAAPVSSSAVLVQWRALVNYGDSFRIDRSTDGGAVWENAGTVGYESYDGGGAYNFNDIGLQSERAVCYRVVTFSTIGTAAPSNTACTIPPAAPTAVTATMVDGGSVDLAWRDNSAVDDGYEVRAVYTYCGNDGFGTWYCFDEEVVLAVLAANTTSYRGPGGSGYPIFVYAMKDGGYSTVAQATYVTVP